MLLFNNTFRMYTFSIHYSAMNSLIGTYVEHQESPSHIKVQHPRLMYATASTQKTRNIVRSVLSVLHCTLKPAKERSCKRMTANKMESYKTSTSNNKEKRNKISTNPVVLMRQKIRGDQNSVLTHRLNTAGRCTTNKKS